MKKKKDLYLISAGLILLLGMGISTIHGFQYSVDVFASVAPDTVLHKFLEWSFMLGGLIAGILVILYKMTEE